MIHWIQENWIEIVGTLAGVIYVVLEIKQNIWLWLVGIITSVLYIVVFFKEKFYADMALNFYYVIISIYGWYWWKFGKQNKQTHTIPITNITLRLGLILLAISSVVFAGMVHILKEYTDSPVPIWDALITALSITATWMLTRKILEQWLVWIFINGLSIFVFLSKQLYPTSFLFLVYFSLAIVGYIEWRKEFKKQLV